MVCREDGLGRFVRATMGSAAGFLAGGRNLMSSLLLCSRHGLGGDDLARRRSFLNLLRRRRVMDGGMGACSSASKNKGSTARVLVSGEEKNVPPPNTTTPTPVSASSKIPQTVVSLSKISMDELREITRNFSNDAFIGEGQYGRVFFGVLKYGQECAVKKLNPYARIHFEVPPVSRLKHKNVVQVVGYCVEGKDHVLAYEYALRGSLHDILHGKKGARRPQPGAVLLWEQRVKIALSAAEGLEFLHENAEPPLTHGRISSSNIFLFGDDVAKIGDPGVPKRPLTYREKKAFDHTASAITRSDFDAPEYLWTAESSTQRDVHNFGVVLMELLSGRKDSAVLEGKVEQIMDPRLEGNYPPNAVAKMAQIVKTCLWHEANMSVVVKTLRSLLATHHIAKG